MPFLQFQYAHALQKFSKKPAPVPPHGHFMGTSPTALFSPFPPVRGWGEGCSGAPPASDDWFPFPTVFQKTVKNGQ